MVGRKQIFSIVLIPLAILLGTAQETNRRTADIRGQSFGLENFLMQPFGLAAQAEQQQKSKRRDHVHLQDPYSVEFQVQNDDFDMRKIVPVTPRGPQQYSHHVDHETGMKPVHEFAETYPNRRFPSAESSRVTYDQPLKKRIPLPETRKPLERPAEFQLTISEGEIPPSSERPRKRVMKRRRKKPTTPQPELESEESISLLEMPKHETTEDLEVNIFTGNSEPEIKFQEPHKSHHRGSFKPYAVQNQKMDTTGPEQRPQRRIPPGFKRQREPIKEEIDVKPSEEVVYIHPPDKKEVFGAEEPQAQPTKEVYDVQEPEILKKDLITPNNPTTELPQQPTDKLKTLLKQQNGQLSLSELLQTQNLSLADFLKGNPGALSALGGKKVNSEHLNTPKPQTSDDKPKYQSSRPNIPKISSKSRPFSKPGQNTTKQTRQPVIAEEHLKDLPKKLDIIEITSERPSYNGFTPKNPRTKPPVFRGNHKPYLPNLIRDKFEEPVSESTKSFTKTEEKSEDMKETSEETTTEELMTSEGPTASEEPITSTQRTIVHRITTPFTSKHSTIAEQRVVQPKRYGDYRSKIRIDRRKPISDGSTEATTNTGEAQGITKATSTTKDIKPTPEPKYKVRIPFMSVNNPEISVILPSKKNHTTTEKPKENLRFSSRERFNLFKRLNQEDKQNEIKAVKEVEATEQPVTTTVAPVTATTKLEEDKTTRITTTEIATTVNSNEGIMESSDEIIELLKMGNNAERLQRILEVRNMTVDELLEKRARSSKQPNVTFLFENKTEVLLNGKGSKVSDLSDNFHPTPAKSTSTKAPLTVFDDFPEFKSSVGEKVTIGMSESQRPHHESNSFDELFVDESVIRAIKIPFESDEKRESKAYETKSNSEKKSSPRLHLNLSPSLDGREKNPMPVWNVDEKSIYNSSPYGYPTYDLNKNLAGNEPYTEESKREKDNRERLVLEPAERSQDSNLKLKHNINEILKEQVEVVKEIHGEEKTFIPPAVKSAIIASGVVMGIALVVFVAIFAACGWKQRQFRLRARSSILNDSLSDGPKMIKATGTLSPISFKRTSLYKKSIEFEDTESSISSSSNTSSYLWNTLKHTFQSRNSTLKNRQEKEEKIQERENRSRRNTLTREDNRSRRNTLVRDDTHADSFIATDLPRRNTITREEHHRDSFIAGELPRRNTLTRDDMRRDSIMSRDTLQEDTRRSSVYRDDTRRLSSLMRENERCSFKKIDPDRNIIQTSVNFKRGGFNGSSRHFDSCDHFN